MSGPFCAAPGCHESSVVRIGKRTFCNVHGLEVVDALDAEDGAPPAWWPEMVA